MADFNKPITTDQYEALLAELRDMQATLATLIDSRGAGVSNLPANAKRWNNANGTFESWESAAWVVKTISIAGGGTGATTAASARAALATNDAANITTGTLGTDRLPTVPVTKGGTGLTLLTTGSFLQGDGTGIVILRTAAQVRTDLSLGTAALANTGDFEASTHGSAATGVHGVGAGDIVGTTLSQTLSNKILNLPVISDFTNAVHTHADPARGGILGATAISGVVGARVGRSLNTVYQAASDGFVVAGYYNGSDRVRFMTGYTGATSSPATVSGSAHVGGRVGIDHNGQSSMCMPILKGEYYKIVETQVDGGGAYSTFYRWVPLGS